MTEAAAPTLFPDPDRIDRERRRLLHLLDLYPADERITLWWGMLDRLDQIGGEDAAA